jgi:c(7)-type cytochrome triheme protein
MPPRVQGGRWTCGARRVATAWLLANLAVPAIALADAATSDIPLRLPADIVYRRTVGPRRAVVFSHARHVAFAQNRCTGCHPLPFRMLSPLHRVTHAAMNAGGSCATCHDGRHAFSSRDSASCSSCHSGMPATRAVRAASGGSSAPRPLPKPIVFTRGDASPGAVTFRHETHVGGARTCSACHPEPFAMSAKTRGGGALHQAGACGSCHDGKKSFAVESADACGRCHVSGGTP